MVKITDYQPRKAENGKEFYALVLQSGIEILKSQNGNMYVTAKKTSIPCTFDEAICQSLIGQEMPGSIERVECAEYTFFLPETGETITRNHKYEYVAEIASHNSDFSNPEVKPHQAKNSQLQAA